MNAINYSYLITYYSSFKLKYKFIFLSNRVQYVLRAIIMNEPKATGLSFILLFHRIHDTLLASRAILINDLLRTLIEQIDFPLLERNI